MGFQVGFDMDQSQVGDAMAAAARSVLAGTEALAVVLQPCFAGLVAQLVKRLTLGHLYQPVGASGGFGLGFGDLSGLIQ
jgi:hypothetical protein